MRPANRRFTRELALTAVMGMVGGMLSTLTLYAACWGLGVKPTFSQVMLVNWVSSLIWLAIRGYRFNRKWQRAIESYSMPSYGEGEDEQYPR